MLHNSVGNAHSHENDDDGGTQHVLPKIFMCSDHLVNKKFLVL